MAFEIFSRKTQRSGSPTMGFSKLGTIAFNKSSSDILQKEAVEYVLLLWDATDRRIGVKAISKKDSRAYRIRYMDKGNGATFSAKTFLDHIEADYSERRIMQITIEPHNDVMINVQVPEEFLKRKQLTRVPPQEHAKVR
jgi:hypothetical protein